MKLYTTVNHHKNVLLKVMYIVLPFVLFGCNNPVAELKTEKKTWQPEGLYSFAQTDDPGLCNPELIVGSDCAGGDLYFMDSTVIYSFYCQGQDSISYEIGKYEANDTVVKCTFTNSYSYLYNEEDTLNQEIYKGVMQTLNKPSTLNIKPINCSEFPYYLSLKWEGEGEFKYVLRKSDSLATEYFRNEIKKIKPFGAYIGNSGI